MACIAPGTVLICSPGQSRDTPQKVGGGAVAVDYMGDLAEKSAWN